MKLKISDIKPNPDNPRVIKDAQYKKLVQSIKDLPKMATIRPIAIDENNVIMGGNQRFRAMQELGWTEIPVVVMTDWTEDEKREFIIKDNRDFGEDDWAKLESWDKNLLEQWGVELPNGFNELEVEEDEAPEVSQDPPVSKLGEIYQLGRHFVMCGDSLNVDNIKELTQNSKLDVSFTSPPYNVGHNLGYSKKKSKYNSSDDNIENYLGLLVDTTRHSVTFAEESFVNLQFLANNKKDLVLYMAEMSDWFKDIFFWKKRQVAPAAAMNVANSQAEVIFYLSENNESDDKEWVDMVGLYGMNNTRRWGNKKFRGTFSNVVETKSASGENKNADIHNATMPVALPSAFFQKGYNAGSTVLDLFGGTGTTLIACEQLGMTAYLMELDPKYVDVIRKRYAKFIGEEDWQAVTPVVE